VQRSGHAGRLGGEDRAGNFLNPHLILLEMTEQVGLSDVVATTDLMQRSTGKRAGHHLSVNRDVE